MLGKELFPLMNKEIEVHLRNEPAHSLKHKGKERSGHCLWFFPETVGTRQNSINAETAFILSNERDTHQASHSTPGKEPLSANACTA